MRIFQWLDERDGLFPMVGHIVAGMLGVCLLGAGPALAGNCLVFGAAGDYADGTGIPTNIRSVTLEAWVYHNAITNRIERYVTLGSEMAVIRHDGTMGPGQLHFYIKTGGAFRQLRANNVLSTGSWHHVAGTWDGTTMRLYKDGVELTNSVPGGTLDAPDGNVTLGSSGEWLDGRIDEARVWSLARTQAQIRSAMRVGLNGDEVGLAGYWRMDEASGATALDSSSNTVNLAINGNASFAASDALVAYGEYWGSGNALNFNGTSAYISIPDAASLDLTANYTLECWFKADALGGLRGLISKYQTGGANGYFLRLNGTELEFDGKTTSGLNLQSGQWYHVAAVNANGERRLFVNAVLRSLSGTPLTVQTNQDPLCLGSDLGGRYFDGQMDEARIWNKAKARIQIKNEKQEGLTGTEYGLVACYHFDQAAGTLLPDRTAHANHGSLVNMSDADWGASAVLFLYTPFLDTCAGLPVMSSAAAWGDYDNDHLLDALHGYEWLQEHPLLFRNNGDETFSEVSTPLSGAEDGVAVWGDFDGDGWADVLDANSAAVRIHRNTASEGGRVFIEDAAAEAGLPPGAFFGSAAWGDYNNDGRLDFVVCDSSFIQFRRNNGDGTFSEDATAAVGIPGVGYGKVAWADCDNDGWLDLFVTGTPGGGDPIARIYRNNGDGTFSDVNAGLPGLRYSDVAWGDYDNDGDLDFALQGTTNSDFSTRMTRIYRNEGSGVFTNIQAGLDNEARGRITWGDYDNDGRPDLLVMGMTGGGSSSGHTCLYRNQGGGVFAKVETILNNAGDGGIAWGDYNNDGRLDLLLNGWGEMYSETEDTSSPGYQVSVMYRGRSVATNAPPSAPTGPNAILVTNGVFALRWGAASDGQTPSAGLSYNLRVGTAPGADDVLAALADPVTGYRRIPALGNVNMNTNWVLHDLPGGTYYWSVQAVDGAFAGGPWAAEGSFHSTNVPTVVTYPVTGIGMTTAACGGDVVNDGGLSVAARGVCWNTNGYPTAADSHTSDGSGSGAFTSVLTGLTADATYYARAYAVNALGTGYGRQYVFAALMLPPGNALDFDGTNDYVGLALDLASRIGGTDVITIEYWFKGDRLQSPVRLQDGAGWIVAGWGDPPLHIISTDGGTAGLSCGPKATVEDGQWHHLAMIWQRDTVNGFRSYLDGAVVTQRTSSASSLPVLASVTPYLGCFNGSSEFLSGSLDEVRIWSVARTTSEIRDNMRHQLNGDEPGLIACFQMNQRDTVTLDDATTNDYDGTLVNGPVWVASTVPWFGLTATAGDHGSIAPTGAAYLARGGSTNFVITPEEYWHVDDVTTNGASVGAVTNFTWTNVVADGSIHADFAADLAALGTPHWWLAQHGLTNGGWTFNQAETNNPDADRFTSGDEYIADTDPTNGASFFCVTNIAHESPVTVHFDSSTGRLYTMHGATDLVDGAWISVPGAGPRMGAGGDDLMIDTNAPAKGPFYRLGVELP